MREVADDGRIAGVSRALQPNLAMRYGLRDVRGYDLPKERRLHRVLGAVGLGGSSRTLIPESLVFPEMEPRLASWLDRLSA
ncbi:MAG: hypothetical protein GTO31_11470, partial [Xanthomonadales bacterium]|nr:hypothetical protein [Xanthomonadales bacterium]